VGIVGDHSVSSYRLHASEAQQPATTHPSVICGVATAQPLTSHGPTCNTP